jgi:hypothetical protein
VEEALGYLPSDKDIVVLKAATYKNYVLALQEVVTANVAIVHAATCLKKK